MNNTPTLSAADRLNALILLLIQALVAQAGIKLPASVVAMIEAQIRRTGFRATDGPKIPDHPARRLGTRILLLCFNNKQPRSPSPAVNVSTPD